MKTLENECGSDESWFAGADGGKRLRIPVEERIRRVPQTVGVDGIRMLHADRSAKLFGQPRQARRSIEHAIGLTQHFLPERVLLQRGENRAHVAERFVERCGFDGLCVEELRPQRVEHGMPHLVADHVGTLARKVGASRDCLMEKMEAGAVTKASARIERIQVFTVVQHHRQHLADLPRDGTIDDAAPEVRGPTQRGGGRVVAERCRARGIQRGWRRRACDAARKRLGRKIRHRRRDRRRSSAAMDRRDRLPMRQSPSSVWSWIEESLLSSAGSSSSAALSSFDGSSLPRAAAGSFWPSWTSPF